MLQKYSLSILSAWLFEVQETEMKTSSSAIKSSESSVESIFLFKKDRKKKKAVKKIENK